MTSKQTKSRKKTAADLGVPKPYLSPTGTFKPGMDARLKSDLILAVLDQPAPNALVKWTKPKAVVLLARFPQWKPFLDKKREILARPKPTAKAKPAAKPAAKRATRKRTGAAR
jgi:hypothetical protein